LYHNTANVSHKGLIEKQELCKITFIFNVFEFFLIKFRLLIVFISAKCIVFQADTIYLHIIYYNVEELYGIINIYTKSTDYNILRSDSETMVYIHILLKLRLLSKYKHYTILFMQQDPRSFEEYLFFIIYVLSNEWLSIKKSIIRCKQLI